MMKYIRSALNSLLCIGMAMVLLLLLSGGLVQIVEERSLRLLESNTIRLLEEIGYHMSSVNSTGMTQCQLEYNDGSVRSLLYATEEADPFDVALVVRRMQWICASNDMVESIFLYNGTLDSYYCTEPINFTRSRDTVDFLKEHAKGAQTYAELRRVYDDITKEYSHRVMSYVITEVDPASKELECAIIVNVSTDWLLANLPQNDAEEGHMLLLKRDGSVLLDRNETEEAAQKLLICMMQELFSEFPEVDGLFIRVGETYLFDEPYHTGNSLIRSSAYEGSEVPEEEEQYRYVLLLNLLRSEVCEKLGKYIFFRTWDCYPDKFHANPLYYLAVTDQITPHEKLIFSVKHTSYDFWRLQPQNPCIGIGKHRQVTEIQCQREYEGKGAYPNYIAHGVLDGFPEQTWRKCWLRWNWHWKRKGGTYELLLS